MRCGKVRSGQVWCGAVRQLRRVAERRGEFWCGKVSLGMVRQLRCGLVRSVTFRSVRSDKLWFGSYGVLRLISRGRAW